MRGTSVFEFGPVEQRYRSAVEKCYNRFKGTPVTGGGRDSSVGIATRCGLDGPGVEPHGGEIFRTRPDRPWGPPSLLYNGYRVFPGGKVAGAWS